MPRCKISGFVAGLTVLLVALLPHPGSGSELPSYYDQLDFNLTSPTGLTTAAGGFANPAVYAMMPGGELEYYWADVKNDPLGGGLHRWGLFLGGENLGFGAVHQRMPAALGGYHSVTDYRLALSGGSRRSTFGVALGWSGGNTDEFGRTTVIQVGSVERLGRHVSFGLAGVFSTEKSDQSGLFDLAVRPFGDQRLTVFGDYELPKGVSAGDAPWSAGAMMEIPSGIKLVGRYFENESFSLGLAVTLGGINAGVMRGSATSTFNRDSDFVQANYGVRVGFPERNAVADWTDHDRYFQMALKGPIVHRRFKYFDKRNTLSGVLSGLEAARKDDRVTGVVMNLAGVKLTHGHAWEIRSKLEEIKADGKPVIVFIEAGAMSTYYLASVADHLVMDPEGFLMLPGYVRSRTYVKDLLDKIGVGVEEIRFKDYKSAAESYVRTDMSEEDREQRQALVDQYYATVQEDVASSRHVSREEFDRWIDELTLMTPQTALDEGLVDELGRWGEMSDIVAKYAGDRKRFISRGALEDKWYPSTTWGTRPKIALLYAVGICALESGINARRLERELRSLSRRSDVKAIVLRVNSPGGSGLASDIVAEAVRKASKRKPVVISMGDVAASGGYWISMYGDEILVQPTTITGSIGVIGAWVWDEGIGEKLGLTYDFVKAGESADLLSPLRFPFIGSVVPHRKMTDNERQRVFDEVGKSYDGFVAKVAAGREMKKEEVEAIAKGRVWTGVQAVDNGLADGLGGLTHALQAARKRAGLDEDDDVLILDYSTVGLFKVKSFTSFPFITPELSELDIAGAFDMMADYDFLYLRKIAESRGRPQYLLPPEFMPQENE